MDESGHGRQTIRLGLRNEPFREFQKLVDQEGIGQPTSSSPAIVMRNKMILIQKMEDINAAISILKIMVDWS
jgi:hypothetical protein